MFHGCIVLGCLDSNLYLNSFVCSLFEMQNLSFCFQSDLKASSKKRGAQPILATQLAQAGPAQPPTGGDHLSSPTSNRDRELDSRPRVRAALRPAPPARLGASTWPYIMRLRTTRPLTPQTLAAIELSGAAPTLATSPPLFSLTVDSPPPRRAPGALRGGS